MTTDRDPALDPARDLRVERLIPAPAATLWRCLTEADRLRRWWVPSPVEITDLVIEPQPGGRFFTHMRLPDGGEHRVEMMILHAEPQHRLRFTDLMTAGFVPVAQPMFGFAAEIALIAEGAATRYVAAARGGGGPPFCPPPPPCPPRGCQPPPRDGLSRRLGHGG